MTGNRVEISASALRLRFTVTIFVSSFLLFLVQPMIAKMALPRVGGAPAVWNSAMLVYQALLLAGYGYAHLLTGMRRGRQFAVHLAVLALAALALPIGLAASTPSPDDNAFIWVPWLILVSIGPLFFIVSANAPLLQRWFSLSGGADPYPLYAASNLGSFAGLISYPLLLEPLVDTRAQSLIWSIGYGLMALLVAWCAWTSQGTDERAIESSEGATPAPGWRAILIWIGLAAIPSGLILSTTLHITTDLMAMPLLWVLPLGAYLLSFTVAFSAKRAPARVIAGLAPVFLILAAGGLFSESRSLALGVAAGSIVTLFVVSVALHGRLFELRPEPRYLTIFYFALSIGGVIGGAFCAIVAPLIFNWTYEHAILLIAAAFLISASSPFEPILGPRTAWLHAGRTTVGGLAVLTLLAAAGSGLFGATPSKIALVAVIAIAVLSVGNRWLFGAAIAALMLCLGGWDRLSLSATEGRMVRSYFGIYSVKDRDGARTLSHGTTIHGIQNLGSPQRERMATTYYAPGSGVGIAMQAAERLFGRQARIGVVGLGAGTLACYARPGQHWTFYEIDPGVAALARDSGQFTFLSRCVPRAKIAIGDARLTLERGPPASGDLLVLDAFSSDSIPMHLLTREAFDTYRRHLTGRGLLLVHISNRFLDLEPVVAATAAAGGWRASMLFYAPGEGSSGFNHTASMWVALSPASDTIVQLARTGGAWRPLRVDDDTDPWSDTHASLLPTIRSPFASD